MPILHFLNFLRPVATVTDKLIRASPYQRLDTIKISLDLGLLVLFIFFNIQRFFT